MRRKLKNLKHKSGHSENGAPRALIDLAAYREHHAKVGFLPPGTAVNQRVYDSEYSGWSNGGGRPRDQAISLRSPFTHGT